MTSEEIIKVLSSKRSEYNREGMARFGINVDKAFGISIAELRKIAKQTGKDHKLAQELWKTGYHEARILACLIDDYKQVTEKQMDKWVKDFDSWDLCDQCCNNLFRFTPFAYSKVYEWVNKEKEFVKRAAFSMMAVLSFHDKEADDEIFLEFLELIKKKSDDERNFVKKAVNWALRQIGKRNKNLNKSAIKAAKEILLLKTKAGNWIARNALREIESDIYQKRLKSPKIV
jgi:3-methyladenine DNA glycosylase AlkD